MREHVNLKMHGEDLQEEHIEHHSFFLFANPVSGNNEAKKFLKISVIILHVINHNVEFYKLKI